MIPLSQENSISLIEQAANNYNNIKEGISNGINNIASLKEGVGSSIDTIAQLSKIIINAINWFTTVIMNPEIIISFVDKMSLVVIMTLLILKLLGFNNLEKWVWLFILIKMVALAII